jgi:hypothetical protein
MSVDRSIKSISYLASLRHNCRLRIYTSAGLVEEIFSMKRTAGVARTALASIKEFLTKVDSTIKKKDK